MTRLEPGYVLPNQKIPKFIGLFNVGFGVTLLLTGIACVALAFFLGNLYFQNAQSGMVIGQPTIASNSIKIGLSPIGPSADVSLSTRVYFWTEVSVGIFLNILMIVSGAGLLRLRNRARKIALWVAGLKILRLAVMTTVTLFVSIPAVGNSTSGSPSAVAVAKSGGTTSQPQMSPRYTDRNGINDHRGHRLARDRVVLSRHRADHADTQECLGRVRRFRPTPGQGDRWMTSYPRSDDRDYFGVRENVPALSQPRKQ